MPSVDFNAVRRLITMTDVLGFIGWRPIRITGSSERGPCPVHGSSFQNSFSVDRQGARFQCFKCGAKGNQLDLYSQVRRLPIYAAALELCERVGVTPPCATQAGKRRGAKCQTLRSHSEDPRPN